MPRLETSSVRDIGLSDDYRCLVELLARGMYLPYLECISENISYLSRMISQYRARHLQKKFTKLYTTTEAAVTLHYAPPPHQALIRQHLTKQPQTTSPLSPTGRLWDHPSLRGRSRRSASRHKTNPPNPDPSIHRLPSKCSRCRCSQRGGGDPSPSLGLPGFPSASIHRLLRGVGAQ